MSARIKANGKKVLLFCSETLTGTGGRDGESRD